VNLLQESHQLIHDDILYLLELEKVAITAQLSLHCHLILPFPPVAIDFNDEASCTDQ